MKGKSKQQSVESQEQTQNNAFASEQIDIDNAFASVTHPKKKAMLMMLEKTLGIVTTASRAVGIGTRTHYDWMSADPEYRALVKAMDDRVIDFAESALHKLIQGGDTAATIFFLKTKGKKRGYVERTEITGRDGEPLRAFSWDELFEAARKNKNAET